MKSFSQAGLHACHPSGTPLVAPSRGSGARLAIAFNARYLVEILNHVDSPQTVLEFLGPLSPAAIKPLELGEGSGEQLYVLMPLRQ